MKRYVIIGNGIAGISAAETIRNLDRRSKITVVAAEPYPLYSRPGLAYYLMGYVAGERLFCHPPDFYEMKRIEQLFIPARHIKWAQKQVILDNGLHLPYDKLLIATGATSNRPQLKGIDLQGAVMLSTLDNAYRIKQLLPLAKQGVVVGGGITAVELVEIFHHHGLETHYLLRGARFWSRLFTQPESELVEKRIKEYGIHLHHQVEITEIVGEQRRVQGVKTNTGQFIPCQMVGIAVGVTPNIDLIKDTPIACDRGILVNEHMETSLPDIYAAGDVAQVFDPVIRQATLDLLWHSALKEGRAAGINMTGRTAPYQKSVPFNSASLFGIPFTSIGYTAPPNGAEDNTQHLSLRRGFSESWLHSHPVHSNDKTLTQNQINSNEHLRLVIRDSHLIGSAILGSQAVADAARDLITQQVNISPIKKALFNNQANAAGKVLVNYWQALKKHAKKQFNGNGNNGH